METSSQSTLCPYSPSRFFPDGAQRLVEDRVHDLFLYRRLRMPTKPFRQNDETSQACRWRKTAVSAILSPREEQEGAAIMSGSFDEKDLQNLDKQTLITMLMMSSSTARSLQTTVNQLNKNINLLTEEVASLRQERFGRKSEKNLSGPSEQYVLIFNEAEVTVDLYKDDLCESGMEEPETQDVPAHKRKKPVGKRKQDLSRIRDREVVRHELSGEELLKLFPDGKWTRLPDEVYERVELIPSRLKVLEHHVAVYKGTSSKEIIKADRPKDLLRNSIATPAFVAAIGSAKFVNAVPIKRLSDEIERIDDIRILTQDMCNWVNTCSDRYLSKLYERLSLEPRRCHVMHADETPCLVNKDDRPAGAKSYMWVYRSGELEEHPFILYDYQKTRKSDHPREFLKDFHGICITDGYQVYHTIDGERDDLNIAGCWAHAKRRFANVVKTLGKASKGTFAQDALGLIDTMYHFEKQFRDLSPDDRLQKRRERILPLADAFFVYLKGEGAKIAPKSKTGEAITYCINQEKYLRVFLSDGYVPMDNNAAERAIRPFCLGKKNWQVIDTVSGAKASAVWYSLAETAKANKLKPYEYFKYLLEEIPKHGEFEETSYLEDLLPWSDKLPEHCRMKETSTAEEVTSQK